MTNTKIKTMDRVDPRNGVAPLNSECVTFVAVTPSEVARLTLLAPATFAVWAVLALEAGEQHRTASLRRTVLLERVGMAATADVRKKLPGKVRALVDAGLCVEMGGSTRDWVRVRFLQTAQGQVAPGSGPVRLRQSDVARVLDADDPLTWSVIQAWLRWQSLLDRGGVCISQADAASRWRIDARTVRNEQQRLVSAGLLEVERQEGKQCRYRAVHPDRGIETAGHAGGPR